MLPKPLLAMIVADTVVLGAFMACVVFQVLSPRGCSSCSSRSW